VLNGRATTDEALALANTFGAERVAIELADVSLPEQATALIDRSAARFGRVDMLVHSAGGPAPGTVMDLTTERWMEAFAIHVHPVFHLFRAAHPYLSKEASALRAAP
jgi:NAD(P)-dependent dehydrogenase (short-subunit alcohol dehydrogenase family)